MAKRGLTTFDPADVYINFSGFELAGISSNKWISISRVDEAFTWIKGLNGYDRKYTGKGAYEIEVALKQTSTDNALLQGFHTADTIGNVGGLPFILADVRGGTNFVSASTWIISTPDADYSMETGDRLWKFHAVNGIFPHTGQIG